MLKFMLNCEETSQLVSQSMDGSLSFMTRLKVGFHLMMCKLCRRFKSQIQFMERVFDKYSDYESTESGELHDTLSSQAKAEIKKALNQTG